ncbi:MAG: type 1 glutamine amidotransferase [Pseudomonadota bacterium]
MARILVVEGNTPAVTEATLAVGGRPAAEQYAGVLVRLAGLSGVELAVRIERPSFPGFEAGTVALDGLDGVALTGSGVAWSADAQQAREHRRLLERVFAAGLPVIGSCWGLQVGAVVLGGAVGASPEGLELGVARHIRLTPAGRAHALHAERADVFDAPCIHRDEVRRMPNGAVLTAWNDHSEVQAMVYEQGGVRFWGMQYHPELGIDDCLRYASRGGPDASFDRTKFENRAALLQVLSDFEAASAAPEAAAPLAWRYGLRPELLDAGLRMAELAAWLDAVGVTAARRSASRDATLPALHG